MIKHSETLLAVADARIAWVLDHPHMSDWLKHAIRTSEGLDPIALRNDVEILSQLVKFRANGEIEILTRGARVENPVIQYSWSVERDYGD